MIFIVLEYVFAILPEQFLPPGDPATMFLECIKLFIDALLFAGIVAVAESQRLTGKADLELMSVGFGKKMGAILASVAIMLLIIIIGIIVPVIIIAVSMPSLPDPEQIRYAIQTENHDFILDLIKAGNIVAIICALIIGLTCPIVAMMLTAFAIQLMIIKQFPLLLALATSFKACLKNILPAVAYFIALVLLLVIIGLVTIPLDHLWNIKWLISTIVTFPAGTLAGYACYRNIFNDSESITD